MVDFPLIDMDLGAYLGPGKSAVYDLYAVSNHIGGISGGHYTAFVLNKTDHNWYELDDSRCSSLDVVNVVTPNAYLLFYSLRDSAQSVWPETIVDEEEEEEKLKQQNMATEKKKNNNPKTYRKKLP